MDHKLEHFDILLLVELDTRYVVVEVVAYTIHRCMWGNCRW